MIIKYDEYIEYIYDHGLNKNLKYKKMLQKLMEWEKYDNERGFRLF